MKDQLLAKMKNWEAEVLGRKCDILQPIVIGVNWWSPDAELDPLNRKLNDFQVIFAAKQQLFVTVLCILYIFYSEDNNKGHY